MLQSDKFYSPFVDALTTHLRAQVTSLNGLIEKIERGKGCDESYIKDSIKHIEREIHRLRRFVEHDSSV